jgi:peroxiredoxin
MTNNSRFSAAIYPVCIVLLLLTNGALLWRQTQLQKGVGAATWGADGRAVAELMEQPLQTLNGETLRLSALGSRYLVLFVFSPSDCAACLEELTELNRIAQGRETFKVVGLMSYASADEMRQTERNFNVRFPLVADAQGRVLKTLHPPKTPWKIVVDVSKRVIVYEDLPSITPAEREAFISHLNTIAGS